MPLAWDACPSKRLSRAGFVSLQSFQAQLSNVKLTSTLSFKDTKEASIDLPSFFARDVFGLPYPRLPASSRTAYQPWLDQALRHSRPSGCGRGGV